MIKALYLDGKIMTGLTHGHAFAKLSEDEKNKADDIISGFFNEKTQQFIDVDNNLEFYTKSIILIRHGSVNKVDSNLSEQGIEEVKKVAYLLCKKINLDNITAYVSPYPRCRQTAQIIADNTRIKVKISASLGEEDATREKYSDFFTRLKLILDALPSKSLIISHSDVIETMIQMATGIKDVRTIPTASVTLINRRRTVCLGFKYWG